MLHKPQPKMPERLFKTNMWYNVRTIHATCKYIC